MEKGANYLEKVISCFLWPFLLEGGSDGGRLSIVRWAELRTVRDVSHWVNDPVQVQGNRGMGVSMRPHTVSQHHISLAARAEPSLTKQRGIFWLTSTFDAFHLFSGIQQVRLNDQCKSRCLNLLCFLFHSLLFVLIMFIVSMLNRGILSTLET